MRYWGRKPSKLIDEIMRNIKKSTIIDPFGGSGSIIISALKHNNKGIYLDINPYAWLVAFVNIVNINPEEFMRKGKEVTENITETNETTLKNDYLYYPNGKPFLKKENTERVSQLFSPENFRKLYSILKGIDNINTSPETKIALYGAFCSSLFKASKMKRQNAGSWGIPSFWIPEKHKEIDAIEAFTSEVKKFYAYFRRNKGYKLGEDVILLIKDSLTFEYPKNLTLFTDPPYFDEIQYMELSFFYWAWLKDSKFKDVAKEILGENVTFRTDKEIIVNQNKNSDHEKYLLLMKKFLETTSEMKEKYLFFHYDNEQLKEKFIKLVKEEWKNIKVIEYSIENHRKIGSRGSNKYILIYSKQRE
jgi:16S rRNA G966 N2-methylase RsmD